jgi:hypothetical protein
VQAASTTPRNEDPATKTPRKKCLIIAFYDDNLQAPLPVEWPIVSPLWPARPELALASSSSAYLDISTQHLESPCCHLKRKLWGAHSYHKARSNTIDSVISNPPLSVSAFSNYDLAADAPMQPQPPFTYNTFQDNPYRGEDPLILRKKPLVIICGGVVLVSIFGFLAWKMHEIGRQPY